MSRNDSNGATLIELIVAMVVTSIISVIALGFLSTVIKGFWKNNKASETVKEMISTKAIVEGKLKAIGTVVSWRKEGIDYLSSYSAQTQSADSARTMVFKDSSLLDNNVVFAKGLEDFSFSVITVGNNQSGQNKGLLVWDATIGNNGWIGGAEEIAVIGRK